MQRNGFERVVRTGRVVTALRAEQRAQHTLVRTDADRQHALCDSRLCERGVGHRDLRSASSACRRRAFLTELVKKAVEHGGDGGIVEFIEAASGQDDDVDCSKVTRAYAEGFAA